MNVQLYNSLEKAHRFLSTVEANENDLARRRKNMQMLRYNPCVLPKKEMKWGLFFLLLLLDGIGILYALYVYLYNANIKRKQKKLENSPEEIRRRKEAQESAAQEKAEFDAKYEEYGQYFKNNYWGCLGFLPDWARKIENVNDVIRHKKYVEGLLGYVKAGANTLGEAMEGYAVQLRELSDMEERREERERLDEYRKKELEKLDTIAKNQERTNAELNKLNNRPRHVNTYY